MFMALAFSKRKKKKKKKKHYSKPQSPPSMATISSSSPLFFNLLRTPSHSAPSPSFPLIFARPLSASYKFSWKPLEASGRIAKAVAEETEGLVSEGESGYVETTSEEDVSVPVSPSDMLTMFFKAEGTMSESEIPAVTKALEGQTGVSDLEVTCHDGVATILLIKETTVQATGVASGLVEILQGAGFKLQSLSLSFEDEEDEINKSMIKYDEEEEE
ncbi:hypothetical protein LUZ60_006826 [Juncus effusus]|nr:hypothetical protein LUZ60_006826 [Juncus effusus]